MLNMMNSLIDYLLHLREANSVFVFTMALISTWSTEVHFRYCYKLVSCYTYEYVPFAVDAPESLCAVVESSRRASSCPRWNLRWPVIRQVLPARNKLLIRRLATYIGMYNASGCGPRWILAKRVKGRYFLPFLPYEAYLILFPPFKMSMYSYGEHRFRISESPD